MATDRGFITAQPTYDSTAGIFSIVQFTHVLNMGATSLSVRRSPLFVNTSSIFNHIVNMGTTKLSVRPPSLFVNTSSVYSHVFDKGRASTKFSVNALETIIAAPVKRKMYWH